MTTTEDKIRVMQAFLDKKIIHGRRKGHTGEISVFTEKDEDLLWDWKNWDYWIDPQMDGTFQWCGTIDGKPAIVLRDCDGSEVWMFDRAWYCAYRHAELRKAFNWMRGAGCEPEV